MQYRTFAYRACLVGVGGALGTLTRALVTLPFSDSLGPWGLVAVNISGAFALGLLIARIGIRTSERSEQLRAFAGVGVLGGFTSYSALATDTIALGTQISMRIALGYTLVTLIAGLAASLLGLAVGSRSRHTGEVS